MLHALRKAELPTSTQKQRWSWIRSAGVDSGRTLRLSFGSGPGVKNLWKKRTGSGVIFSISAVAGVCVVISKKTLVDFRWIDGSRSVNRSRILKFENFPNPHSKILEQVWSRSLTKWLRPPLLRRWNIYSDKIIVSDSWLWKHSFRQTIVWDYFYLKPHWFETMLSIVQHWKRVCSYCRMFLDNRKVTCFWLVVYVHGNYLLLCVSIKVFLAHSKPAAMKSNWRKKTKTISVWQNKARACRSWLL